MTYYITQAGSELIREAHKGGGDAQDARKASNTGGGQQSGATPKMGGDFAPSQGSPDARVAQKKKVPFMRRMGQLVGKMADRSGRHINPYK